MEPHPDQHLSAEQCVSLLGSARWARIATTCDALPTIEVARCRMEGDDLLLSPPLGAWSSARNPIGVVAIEMGQCDDQHAPQWSVVLVGVVQVEPGRPLPAATDDGQTADAGGTIRVRPQTVHGWRSDASTPTDGVAQ
jgi:hypothetical protein